MIRLIALTFVLAAGPSFAQDATLSKVSGPVFLRADGSAKYVPARGGEELIYGDAVKTGPGGTAHVLIGKRGAVLVRENSVFALQGNPANVTLRFTLGEFLVGLREKLKNGESFRVRTPSSVAAVRGTLFWGKTDAAKTSTYAGFGHEIAVTAKGKTVLVRAGETTTIAADSVPADPSPHVIAVSYLDNFKIDGSLEDLGGLVDLPAAKKP